MSFYLFRHGETYFSKNSLPYGNEELTAQILPEAIPVSKRLGEYLNKERIDIAKRSEFLRCQQTSKIIEENSNLVFENDLLLNEFTEKDFSLFHKRMEELVIKLKKIENKNVALCTHGAVVAALQKMLLGEAFNAHDLMSYPKPGIIVKIEDNTKVEINFRNQE